MLVRELISKLGFDIDENKVRKVDAIFDHFTASSLALVGVFTGIGVGLYKLVQTTANTGDNLIKTSQRLGIGVVNLQKFQYAAELADVETDTFTQSIGLFSRKLIEASGGSKEASGAFTKLGVKIKDSTGKVKPTDDLLLELADKFQKLPDGAQKTALAMDLFGRSGLRMIPFLNGGSAAIVAAGKELEDFGIIIGQDAAEASEKFNDSLRTVHVILTGFKNMIGAKLIPIALQLVKLFIGWLKVNKDLIKSKLTDFIMELVGALKVLYGVGRTIYDFFAGIVEAVGGAENAVRLLTLAFAIFYGAKLVSSIMTIISTVWSLAKALLGGAAAATAMDLAVAAIPLLIAALAAAIYLLVDDIQAFIEGRPSLFAPFYEKAVPYVMMIKELWGKLTGFLSDVWTVFVHDVIPLIKTFWNTFIDPVFKAIGAIGQLIGWLFKTLHVFDLLGKLIENSPLGLIFKGAKLALGAQWEALKQGAEGIHNRAEQIRSGQAQDIPTTPLFQPGAINNALSAFTTPPSVLPGAGVMGPTNQSNDVKIDQKFDIKIDGAQDPATIADTIQKSMDDKMGNALRGAYRALEPGHK